MKLILFGFKKEITSNDFLIQNWLDSLKYLSEPSLEVSGRSRQAGGQRRNIHIQALLLTGPTTTWANCLIHRVNMRIQ